MKIQEGNIVFYPRISDDEKTVYRRVAYALTLPANYDKSKPWAATLMVHGKDERGKGKMATLYNLMYGMDYDGAGPLGRQYAIATPASLAEMNEEGVIGIWVNYETDLSPADINYVLEEVAKEYNIDETCRIGIGFSLGGGVMLRYVTSSLENAKTFNIVVACAPVNSAGNLQYVADAKLQLILTTNQTDPIVSPTNAKTVYNKLMALNPVIKPQLIIFPFNGHGSINEWLAGDHKYIPQSMYKYNKASSTVERKQYPVTGDSVPPTPTTPTTPTVEPKAVVSYSITGNQAVLKGTESTGWAKGYEGVWSFVSGPAGVTAKQVFPNGSSFITATANLPVPGVYKFKFTLSGAPTQPEVNIQHGPLPDTKTGINFVWPNKLVMSDGSDLWVEAQFKAADGTIYTPKP